ncbi:MAG: Methionine synthase II cobalamin-independent MetE [Candidatus Methanohalarchaeum thermophilum]|uniref:Methionine synthase n=1 Tax=Methanohalarchaeum thermophilum TaxID=1903181 RepID=A0A1Q6DXH4_METT1|nr:MAG: Methionine synthase II cobalamin-independent MetE [Candidatus Methanohalarchaeum thermophilum]
MKNKLFPTTIIGSYPKPKWLNKSKESFKEENLDKKYLNEALDDASRLIVDEHERAGVDILNDGEMRREEMVEFFAEKIPGFKFYGPVRVWGNNYFNKPSVVKELKDPGPMLVDEFNFIKDVKSPEKEVKIPITGPYTIADWSFNEIYDRKELVMELAEIINKELKRLVDAGAEYIQIDEPALSTKVNEVNLVKEATSKVVKGVNAEKIIMHACYGEFDKIYPDILNFDVDQFSLEFVNNNFEFLPVFKEYDFTRELGLGCVDVHDSNVESVQEIVNNIKKGLEIVEPSNLYVNPDCGLKLLPREKAYQKLSNMVKAASKLREKY